MRYTRCCRCMFGRDQLDVRRMSSKSEVCGHLKSALSKSMARLEVRRTGAGCSITRPPVEPPNPAEVNPRNMFCATCDVSGELAAVLTATAARAAPPPISAPTAAPFPPPANAPPSAPNAVPRPMVKPGASAGRLASDEDTGRYCASADSCSTTSVTGAGACRTILASYPSVYSRTTSHVFTRSDERKHPVVAGAEEGAMAP